MPTTGDNPDAAVAAALAAWLHAQPVPARPRGALLRDLQLITGERPAAGREALLRGLDRDGLLRELEAPDGGLVGRVPGIGAKALAGLRAALRSAEAEAPAPPAAGPPAPAEAPPTPPAPAPGAGGDTDGRPDALAALSAAAAGLLVPSERDHPLTPFRWQGPGPLTPAGLRAQLNLPPDTPVETRSLEAFFAPLSRVADWMDAEQRAEAGRFAALRDQMAALLADPVVYRAGRTTVTAVIAGQDPAGATVGLRTTLVET